MASNSLAPPTLAVDTRGRSRSNTAETTTDASGRSRSDTIETRAVTPAGSFVSNVSNPFLTPSTSINPFLTPAQSDCGSSVITVDPESALRPDPGTEADFEVKDNPFAFSPGQLNKLFNPKSPLALRALGGLSGIQQGLQTDVKAGLSIDETTVRSRVTFDQVARRTSDKIQESSERVSNPDSHPFADRVRVYGNNVLPAKKATPLWKLIWIAFKDKVIILLAVAATVSLALGLYETFGVEHEPGSPPAVDWIEGVAIIIAILIVTLVGSLNDWQKERAFVRLNAKKEDREIKVVRSGKSFMINVRDILVGDVLHLEPGDLVPVDGILIDGHDIKCDESSATGESDAIKKTPSGQVMTALESGNANTKGLDPFIISGAKVLEGVGTFLCTSVGVHSSFGKIMVSVQADVEATPLQKKLERLAVAIAQLGASAAVLLFFVLLFRFLANLPNDSRSPPEKASSFLDILIVAVTIVVVAVPEGLPLAVTLALAFATQRLLKENNLVRVLRACETMGNATTICSDKTGTLTTNRMTVVAGSFGQSGFVKPENENAKSKTVSQWAADLPQATKDALVQSVAINSTAFEGEDAGQFTFIGSKTETALLEWAKNHLGMQSLPELRANEPAVHMMPFDSGKKCMGAVIKVGTQYRLLVKGASEILLGYCNNKADAMTLADTSLTDDDRMELTSTIDKYAKDSLRTIGLVYRDYPEWPPSHAEVEDGHVQFASILKDLTWLGVVGIQDPVRPGVPEAVRLAQHAGVTVRMVTGDNAVTAQAIATECGIYTDGLIMEGPVFRALSDEEMNEKVKKLQVLARSSPEDKRILVAKLKALNETVAVTGDGTNDAPALKTADVGFSMGVCGTEVAKEASEIVLMDDNFTSILTALKWGRAVNDAVQKFLQFQVTVNITAVLVAFISAVANPDMKSVLTAVQLLWVNLIMDTFAALALATDPPTDKILNRLPQPKSAPLITVNMWKMIIGQTIYQLVVTFTLYFGGNQILGYDPNNKTQQKELATMVFNTFVWMQIFNEFNNRRLDNKFNIFEGVHRNKFFIGITVLMVGLQVLIIFVGGAAFEIKPIDGVQWAICIVSAFICLPWAVLIRLFPDEWFAAVAKTVGAPVVVLYQLVAKALRKTGSLFRRKRQGEEPSQTEAEESEKSEKSSGSASVPAIIEQGAPAIILPEDGTDEINRNPTIQVEDIEKGRV
ncbi:calcium-translocating P-type ATPase [Xylaria bambusicola]|uniref:calcium-translocating P-type ATPase n=1 Tax=Xylaria bambusicola TaxID=326684 RepID=UPI002008AD23|nr:calcium-translocating P-type ATPase [Xylaria bambusicola]KAI0508832.1 calcium-translocating P-type ATPase [Xylaria bambusicola]